MIFVFSNAGNADALGTELLESLLKMAPTKEEERKLKECKDDSPIKLGPAEKFLKALLDIPLAFKRVDAMLYIANFESEVEYLKKSFETLEASHLSLFLSTHQKRTQTVCSLFFYKYTLCATLMGEDGSSFMPSLPIHCWMRMGSSFAHFFNLQLCVNVSFVFLTGCL